MLKLVTSAFGQKNTILVTNTRTPLGAEVLRQLQQYPHLEIKSQTDSTSELPLIESVTAIIHLPTLGSDLLAEIVSQTSSLHRLLSLAKNQRAKFVLAIPDTHSPVYETAVQMVVQFGKNYQLPYHIFEISPDVSPTDSAEAIIKKIVFKHKNLTPIPTTASPSLPLSEKISPAPPPTTSPIIAHKSARPPLKLPQISFPKISLPSLSFPRVTISSDTKKYFKYGLYLLLFPWALTLLSSAIFATGSYCVYKSLFSQHLTRANICAKAVYVSNFSLKYTSLVSIGARPAMDFLGLPQPELESVVVSLTRSLSLASSLSSQARLYLQNSLSTTDNQNLRSSSDLRSDLGELTTQLATVQNDLKSLSNVSTRPLDNLNEIATYVAQMREISSKSQAAIADILPIFETPQTKKVAILIQDNSEQRPSGGYLDSFALITIENFKITGWRLIKTSDADQQLLGAVEPPSSFKTATGQLQWYLRDSNWSLDFRNTANQAAWFIQKEIGESPDLIIATNLDSLAHFAQILGPIKIGLAGTVVDPANYQTEYLAYLKDHPDNNDYLKTLTEKILDRTKTSGNQEIEQLANLAVSLLTQHQLLVAVPNKPTPGLDASGWNGSLQLPKCRSALPCVVDIYGQYDTNLGVNKTDFYLKQTRKLTIDITATGVETHSQIHLENTSPATAWPAGINKNYLRVALPPSVQVTNIKVGESDLKKPQFTQTNENGLLVTGFSVTTPPTASTSVDLVSSQTLPLDNNRFHYQLNIPSQPGVSSFTSWEIQVNYPKNWFATTYTNPAFASQGSLQYNLPSNRENQIDIDFTAPPTL